MAYRCINAFTFVDRVIAGGALIDDDDPILNSHAAHFVAVAEPPALRGETASTDKQRRRPGRPRKERAESPIDAPATVAAEAVEGDDLSE